MEPFSAWLHIVQEAVFPEIQRPSASPQLSGVRVLPCLVNLKSEIHSPPRVRFGKKYFTIRRLIERKAELLYMGRGIPRSRLPLTFMALELIRL